MLYLMVLHGTILSQRKITASFYLDFFLSPSFAKDFSMKLNMNEKYNFPRILYLLYYL